MTGPRDPAAIAIMDARALLAALMANGWREMHVVSGDYEIFIAMEGARQNPMRAPATTPRSHAEGRQIIVKAPHVATLARLAADGSRVAKGETLATISVLGEEIAVIAPSDGVAGQAEAAIGTLLEFDQPILRFCEVA